MEDNSFALQDMDARAIFIRSQLNRIVSPVQSHHGARFWPSKELGCLSVAIIECHTYIAGAKGQIATPLLPCVVVKDYSGGAVASRVNLPIHDCIWQLPTNPNPDRTLRIHHRQLGYSKTFRSLTFLCVDRFGRPPYRKRSCEHKSHEYEVGILLAVDGKTIIPPEHPVFPMGATSEIVVVGNDQREQTVTAQVAKPKGKKLQFVEPTLVKSKVIDVGIGYLSVTMFPGLVGVEVANQISSAVSDLGEIRGLIMDLRGNTGGGVGALRLMSLLTPGKVPVGFAPSKRWAGRDLNKEKVGFPRFGSIPASTKNLWLQGLRYLPYLIMQSPIVLESEGCGVQPYQGNVVLLVDRHTASAAEMVVMFAKENRLATVVGERTAGRLLSASSVKVGHGFRLAFPTGAYYTWDGTALEGNPIEPDVLSEFDWQGQKASVMTGNSVSPINNLGPSVVT